MTDTPTAQPALSALLDLAEATRPDIDRTDLQGALIACHDAGWTWPRTLKAAAQVLADGETPYDLRAAATAPWQRHTRKDTR